MKRQIYLLACLLLLFSCNHRQKTAIKTNNIAYLQAVPPIRFCGPTNAVLNTPPGFDGTLVPLFAGLTENFTYVCSRNGIGGNGQSTESAGMFSHSEKIGT